MDGNGLTVALCRLRMRLVAVRFPLTMPWDIEITDKAALVSMNSNPVGTINERFLEDLRATFSTLAKEHPTKPVALTSAGRMFSPGLDLEECLPMFRRGDKKEIDDWFERFLNSLLAVLEHPAPVYAAVGGPAIAGGCLLALCCDIRIAEEGKTVIGMNESTIGFPIPASIDALVKGALGTRKGRRIMKSGILYDAWEAQTKGIINLLCPPGKSAEVALEEAGRATEGEGGGKAKAHITGKVKKLFRKEDSYRLAGRLSDPETVDKLENLLKTLKKAKEAQKARKAAQEAAAAAGAAETKAAQEAEAAQEAVEMQEAVRAQEAEARKTPQVRKIPEVEIRKGPKLRKMPDVEIRKSPKLLRPAAVTNQPPVPGAAPAVKAQETATVKKPSEADEAARMEKALAAADNVAARKKAAAAEKPATVKKSPAKKAATVKKAAAKKTATAKKPSASAKKAATVKKTSAAAKKPSSATKKAATTGKAATVKKTTTAKKAAKTKKNA